MKGDFSRDTFDPLKHFTRVLMQQGRVQLDSDWNEQTSLLLHFVRTLAADILGPHGGPAGFCGFRVINPLPAAARNSPEAAGADDMPQNSPAGNFMIGAGRYYVGGLLCENDRVVYYAPTESLPGREQADIYAPRLEAGQYLVYLDAWEQHVTAYEDESIREVALGPQGPDTASRARVAWQVRTFDTSDLPAFNNLTCESIMARESPWHNFVADRQPRNRGRLRAKAEEEEDPASFEPCIISPDARFRGAENQLYRVEIHKGGTAESGATFKWSRENGSVVLPVRSVSGNVVTLDRMGRDARTGVEVGDWVEVFDETSPRIDPITPLLRVTNVDPVEMTVTLAGEPHAETEAEGRATPVMKNPLLRRWDQRDGDPARGGLRLEDGAARVVEGTDENNWLELEDGVRIQFVRDANDPATYRPGDYWLIPARTETGDVEWPGEQGKPEPRPPHGVQHYYAPLARITVGQVGGVPNTVTVNEDYRRAFQPYASCGARVAAPEEETLIVTGAPVA